MGLKIEIHSNGKGTCSFSDKSDVKGFTVTFEGDPGESFMSDGSFVKQIRHLLRTRNVGQANGEAKRHA
jgi:hypothetical protein